MVRLGEHDLTTERDGRHEDVRIKYGVPHEHYNKYLGINDIAIVYLAKDVQYNGMIIFIFNILPESQLIQGFFELCSCNRSNHSNLFAIW